MQPPRPRYRRSESGAVAIVVALSFVGLLVAGALVFDFGVVRVDRTSNKLAADAAASAGIRSIEALDGSHKPWAAACAALAYLRVNGAQFAGLAGAWRSGSGIAVSGDPCLPASPLRQQTCVPDSPSSWAWFSGIAGSGSIAVNIRTGYKTPDPGFPEDQSLLSGDNGTSASGGCDQLAVIIEQTRHPGLGSLATSADMTTRVRSVTRATIPTTTLDVPALLLLERHNCIALDVNGNGPFIEVKGNGPAPGSIHSDSLGDGTGCSNVNKVINGNTTIPGILAHKAETGGRPGIITVTALSGGPGAVSANASDPSPDQVNAEGQPGGAPTGRALVGRGYVDQRFLPYVQATISDAISKWSTKPAGFAEFPAAAKDDCNKITGAITGQYLYFNCPTAKFNNANLPQALEVIVNGGLQVSSGNNLLMPKAQKVYVRGGAGTSFDVKGDLSVNDNGAAVCPAVSAARTRLVVGQGSFSASATSNIRMCGTAVIMADNTGVLPCPLPLTVTIPGSTPYANTCGGTINVGGGGTLQWSAPNATESPPTTADKAELEDLALWTETSSVSSIGGNGTMTVSGVFFAPNADPFKIAGKSSQTNGANAQFVSRRLEVNGNGQLTMRPNPNDAVGIPQPTEYGLVR